MITLNATNTGRRSGNFSVIVKQCCVYMTDLTVQCYITAIGDLSYTILQGWLVANMSEQLTLTMMVSILMKDNATLPSSRVSKSLSCDMEAVEASNLTTLSFYYSLRNDYAMPPTISSSSPKPTAPINPKALSFEVYFQGAASTDVPSVLIAR